MNFLKKKMFFRKSKDRQRSSRKDRVKKKDSISALFFKASQVIEAILFVLFLVLLGAICFLGQKPKGPRIILIKLLSLGS